jgi:hypothetical protein
MKEDIHIYNHFHYGDIFYSRSIVQLLQKKYKINYYHGLKHGLFKDLTFVNEISYIPNEFSQSDSINNNKINSWLGAHSVSHSCSYYSNLEILKKISDVFEIPIDDEISLLPEIIYDNLPMKPLIQKDMTELKKRFKKIILISTGNVHSGQSVNFDFSPIIFKLIKNFPDFLFITTTKIFDHIDNLIFTGDITRITPDLLEISYISTFCDVIIGRASGPFCFTHTKKNITDKNKIFISFSNIELEGKFYFEGDSKKIWSKINN